MYRSEGEKHTTSMSNCNYDTRFRNANTESLNAVYNLSANVETCSETPSGDKGTCTGKRNVPYD